MRVETLHLSEHAALTAYLHSASPDLRAPEAVTRPAIIICPGGRYAFCADVERDAPAIAFLNMGLQVFVLDYSVEPFAGDKRPLTDLALAIKLVRERSAEWQIDAHKIAVCGFSAGGHLAASLGVHWNDSQVMSRCGTADAALLRPDAMVLCYPVITAGEYRHKSSIANVSSDCEESLNYWSLETQVSTSTPPTFLWHTMTDKTVPVENSIFLLQQLRAHGVPCECHLFAEGPHGMSAATRETGKPSAAVHEWIHLCRNWLSAQFGPLGGEAR